MLSLERLELFPPFTDGADTWDFSFRENPFSSFGGRFPEIQKSNMSDGEGSCPQPVKKTRLSIAKAEEAAFQTEGSGDENVSESFGKRCLAACSPQYL